MGVNKHERLFIPRSERESVQLWNSLGSSAVALYPIVLAHGPMRETGDLSSCDAFNLITRARLLNSRGSAGIAAPCAVG
jgi:hypothetical protein